MQFIRTAVFCQFLCLLGFIHAQSNPDDITEDIRCPSLWVRIHRGCYRFVTEEAQWGNALDQCKSHGGELTTIQSWKEKEELQTYMAAKTEPTQQWWVGMKRNATATGPWKWIDENIFDSNIIPWSNPNLKNRQGEFCGYVDMETAKLRVTINRCSGRYSFICEYHSILPRSEPTTEATTITATTESTTLEIPDAPPPTTDTCSCSDSADVLPSDAGESPENRLKRRNQALTVDEELYQRYLQSEIDANNAKVVYYSEVAKYYQEALEAQNKYYNSYKQKLDLEINKLQEGTACT